MPQKDQFCMEEYSHQISSEEQIREFKNMGSLLTCKLLWAELCFDYSTNQMMIYLSFDSLISLSID